MEGAWLIATIVVATIATIAIISALVVAAMAYIQAQKNKDKLAELEEDLDQLTSVDTNSNSATKHTPADWTQHGELFFARTALYVDNIGALSKRNGHIAYGSYEAGYDSETDDIDEFKDKYNVIEPTSDNPKLFVPVYNTIETVQQGNEIIYGWQYMAENPVTGDVLLAKGMNAFVDYSFMLMPNGMNTFEPKAVSVTFPTSNYQDIYGLGAFSNGRWIMLCYTNDYISPSMTEGTDVDEFVNLEIEGVTGDPDGKWRFNRRMYVRGTVCVICYHEISGDTEEFVVVLTKDSGETWSVTSFAAAAYLKSVTYSAEKGVYVFAMNGGDDDPYASKDDPNGYYVYSTDDCVTFKTLGDPDNPLSEANLTSRIEWDKIIWVPELGHFVGVSKQNRILVSNDGVVYKAPTGIASTIIKAYTGSRIDIDDIAWNPVQKTIVCLRNGRMYFTNRAIKASDLSGNTVIARSATSTSGRVLASHRKTNKSDLRARCETEIIRLEKKVEDLKSRDATKFTPVINEIMKYITRLQQGVDQGRVLPENVQPATNVVETTIETVEPTPVSDTDSGEVVHPDEEEEEEVKVRDE